MTINSYSGYGSASRAPRGVARRYSSRTSSISGMGQVSAGGYSTCAAYLAANLAALPSVGTAAALLNTGSPSGSVLAALFINSLPSTPQATAQTVVAQLAQEYCQFTQDQVVFGGTVPVDCVDGGTAAANAAYPSWLAYYSALPASVWSTGMVSQAQANPQLNVLSPTAPSMPTTPTGPTAAVLTPAVSTPVITSGGGGNVLTPPANTPAVSPGTVQQNQTGSGTALGPTGTVDTSTSSDVVIGGVDVTSWIEDNWVLIAVAAGGLILLSTMGSKR
jgi:hypothetical protein